MVIGQAKLCLASPVERGFLAHPLLDYLGAGLGMRLCPCLVGSDGDLHWILWPQITIQSGQWALSPDGLLLACLGGRRLWFAIDLDGLLHTLNSDKNRDNQFHIGVLRFKKPVIQALDLTAQLNQALRAAFSDEQSPV